MRFELENPALKPFSLQTHFEEVPEDLDGGKTFSMQLFGFIGFFFQQKPFTSIWSTVEERALGDGGGG